MITLHSHLKPQHHQSNRKLVAAGATALLGLIAAGILLAQIRGYRMPLWFCLLSALLLLVPLLTYKNSHFAQNDQVDCVRQNGTPQHSFTVIDMTVYLLLMGF